MADEAAERGHLAQRPLDEHVGGRADAPGARVERAVLRDSRGSRPSRPRAGRRAAAARRASPGTRSTAMSCLRSTTSAVARAAVHLDPRRARDDVRRGDDDVRPRDPAGALDAEPAGGGGDADDARPRAARHAAEASTRRVGRHRRRRRPGDLRERIDAGERAQDGARRRDRVQPLEDHATAAPRARSFVWPGSWSSTAPATQTIARPSAAPASETAERVEHAQRRNRPRAPPRANEPIDRRDGLQQERADDRARRAPTSGVYGEVAPSCRKCGASRAPSTAPAASPASESAVAISPRLSPDERGETRDRQRDPVDAGHQAHLAESRSIPAAATLPAVPGA